MGTLSKEEFFALYTCVKNTLKEMTDKGGRDTEKDLFGNNGGYCTKLSAKTINDPCKVCEGNINKEAYMGGNIYYCVNCQKK